jgi:cell division protein FtsL
MKAPRWFALAALVVIAVLAVGLYRAKTDAMRARDRIAGLEATVNQAEREVSALEAEAQMLESPARLEEEAAGRLGLEPGAQARAQDLSAIEAIPLRDEAVGAP